MAFESPSYAIANYLTFTIPEAEVQFRFQNFYLNQEVPWTNGTHRFLPFGFSGITVDRNGGNVDASLVFPNSDLTRPWGEKAITQFWLARLRVVQVDPDDPQVAADNPEQYRLYNYVGQVTAGTWDDKRLSLRLSSVLDAVRSNAPNRKLNRSLCGHLPTTNRIAV